MENVFSLVKANRSPGSMSRERLAGMPIQYFYNYRGINLAMWGDAFFFEDAVLSESSIDSKKKTEYRRAVQEKLASSHLLETGTNEQIYRTIYQQRLNILGNDIIKFNSENAAKSPHDFTGIDQTELGDAIFSSCKTVVFALTDSDYLPDFLSDIKKAANNHKHICCICSDWLDGTIPTADEIARMIGIETEIEFLPENECFGCIDPARVPCSAALQQAVEKKEAYYLGYGEDALSSAHGLKLPALIKVTPVSFYCRAVTNIFSKTLPCAIYVPAGFSIQPYVPITEPSILTYYHLSELAKRFGTGIYEKTPQQLYYMAPGLFANIYDDRFPQEDVEGFVWDGKMDYRQARDNYYDHVLNSCLGFRYFRAYYSCSTGKLLQFDWKNEQPEDAFLVHGVCASPDKLVSAIFNGNSAISPRQYWLEKDDAACDGIVSNFSFFLTKRLWEQYNAQRIDRPQECISYDVGHIDYKMYYDAYGRHESFPLYKKACLAKKKDGTYLAFQFRVGGGTVCINGVSFTWRAQQVDAPADTSEIQLFTPMISGNDEEKTAENYRKLIGNGRLNVVFVGEKIVAIRQGDVILPCIGVVLSLSGRTAASLQEKLGEPNEQGYFDCTGLDYYIRLDPPEQFMQDEWNEIEWIYGGGLTLIKNGVSITNENYIDWYKEEGWTSPLSRQTQESDVHTLSRHPRTAVGITEEGEIFILVFSGRTKISVGANYIEMCDVAKKLVPNIRYMINWDGGASSVLGWVKGNRFVELSYTAPSDMSCAGMARQINSMLFISRKSAT